MKAVFSDTTTALTRFEEQVRDLAKAANERQNLLESQAESLVRLTRCLSRKETTIRSAISKENQKNKQHRVSDSTRLIINLEARASELKQCIKEILRGVEDIKSVQSDQITKILHEQSLVFDQINRGNEASVSKIADMIAIMEQTRQSAIVPQQVENTGAWLSEIAKQLLISGLTSGMTGVVVALAMQDDGKTRVSDNASAIVHP